MVTATSGGIPAQSAASDWTRYPSPSGTTAGDLHISTVDTQGRLWVRQPALRLGWMPEMRLAITIHDGVVRVRDSDGRQVAVETGLDRRYRIQVPFGLRMTLGLLPGVRTLVVSVPAERSVAILPVGRVLAALTGAR